MAALFMIAVLKGGRNSLQPKTIFRRNRCMKKAGIRTRICGILLTCAMLLTLLPATALAAGDGEAASNEAAIGGTEYVTLTQAFAQSKDGDTITLLKDVTLRNTITVSGGKSITLDMDKHTITYSVQTYYGMSIPGLIKVQGTPTTLTITGDGTFTIDEEYASKSKNGNLLETAASGSLVIKNGTYEAGLICVEANTGSVTIEGGTFSAKETYNGAKWLLNKIDNTNTSITVTGGTFVGFNPADCVSEGGHTSYVPAEYESTEDPDGAGRFGQRSTEITVDASAADGTANPR
jgi:hypothetical protein